MSSLRLTLRGLAAGASSGPRERYFEVLNDYLQPASSLKAGDTAKSIDALSPTKQESVDAKGTEDFVWGFWDDVDQLASQIPHDHGSQDKLVDVIRELKALPSTTITVWGNEQRLWTDLPLAGPVFRDAWVGPREGDKTSQDQWVNKNAFLARLFGASVVAWQPNFAVWTLRDALESNQTQEKDLRSCYITAAATWIDYAGRFVYDWARTGEADQQFVNITAPGDLYKGSGGLTTERWAFWKSRFDSLSTELEVGEARKRAGEVAAKMGVFEGGT